MEEKTISFRSEDLNDCRAFLRAAGLEATLSHGWTGNGKLGAIYYTNNKIWVASYWPSKYAIARPSPSSLS